MDVMVRPEKNEKKSTGGSNAQVRQPLAQETAPAFYATADTEDVQGMQRGPQQPMGGSPQMTDVMRNMRGHGSSAPAQENRPKTESADQFRSQLENIILRHIINANLDSNMPKVPPGIDHAITTEELFKQVKAAFAYVDNVDTLILKTLSYGSELIKDPYNEYGLYNCYGYLLTETGVIKDSVFNLFQYMAEPIQQTLNDICYWVIGDYGIKVNAIILTDSDIHSRGVGVCIVEYRHFDDPPSCEHAVVKRIVIKPEDKTFEKNVYGTSDGSEANKSLAEDFNTRLDEKLIEGINEQGKISTLDIRLSNQNAFGSAVEYREHIQFPDVEKNNIDLQSVYGLMAFSSLVGLGDLHRENAVYYQPTPRSPYRMQPIDVEVGVSYPLKQELYCGEKRIHPLSAPAVDGEMYGVNGGKDDSISLDMATNNSIGKYNLRLMRGFFINIQKNLKGLSTRIVVIGTGILTQLRYEYFTLKNPLGLEPIKEGYVKGLKDGLASCAKKGFAVTEIGNLEICASAAIIDFEHGRIPFFILDIDSGQIFQVVPKNRETIHTDLVSTIPPDKICVCKLKVPFSNKNLQFVDAMLQNNWKVLYYYLEELKAASGK